MMKTPPSGGVFFVLSKPTYTANLGLHYKSSNAAKRSPVRKNELNAAIGWRFWGGLSLLRLYSGACFQHKMNESIKPTL